MGSRCSRPSSDMAQEQGASLILHLQCWMRHKWVTNRLTWMGRIFGVLLDPSHTQSRHGLNKWLTMTLYTPYNFSNLDRFNLQGAGTALQMNLSHCILFLLDCISRNGVLGIVLSVLVCLMGISQDWACPRLATQILAWGAGNNGLGMVPLLLNKCSTLYWQTDDGILLGPYSPAFGFLNYGTLISDYSHQCIQSAGS